jgi:hypothetical protein
MVFPVATIRLRAQPAIWRAHSSIGTKYSSPPLPSDFTAVEMGEIHMRNSSKRTSSVSKQGQRRGMAEEVVMSELISANEQGKIQGKFRRISILKGKSTLELSSLSDVTADL